MGSDELRPSAQTYFGADEGRYPAMSTISGVAASPIPTMIGVAELDPLSMHEQAWLLITQLYLRNRLIPPMVWAPGHNHVSYVLGLGVDDDSVLDNAVRRFIADIMNARRVVHIPTRIRALNGAGQEQ